MLLRKIAKRNLNLKLIILSSVTPVGVFGGGKIPVSCERMHIPSPVPLLSCCAACCNTSPYSIMQEWDVSPWKVVSNSMAFVTGNWGNFKVSSWHLETQSCTFVFEEEPCWVKLSKMAPHLGLPLHQQVLFPPVMTRKAYGSVFARLYGIVSTEHPRRENLFSNSIFSSCKNPPHLYLVHSVNNLQNMGWVYLLFQKPQLE